ncbi:MAG: hypothetical protein U0T82_12620 [Bacteroidales bacterium]
MRKLSQIISLAGITLIIALAAPVRAQDSTVVEKKTPDLAFIVKKITNGDFLLSARVSWYEKRKDYPVTGVPVEMLIGEQPAEQIKITASTNSDGYAEALIQKGVKVPRDKDGVIHCKAVFTGTDAVEPAETEFLFTEVNLSLSLELVDSVKTVLLKAFRVDGSGKELPLEGESVGIAVQRMLSNLPVGDISIDAEGNGSLEFPADLPGEDSLGTLEVIASIAENEVYGNVEFRQKIAWGTPKPVWAAGNRTLWSHIAPVWMIVSLTIMLIGVWAHYLYVIIQLIRIRKKGKPEKLENIS